MPTLHDVDMNLNGPTQQPLSQWTCDTCGDLVAVAGDGIVVWRESHDGRAHHPTDFRLVHKTGVRARCDPGFTYSMEIADLLGPAGQSFLLSFLSSGPMAKSSTFAKVDDLPAFVDLFRRLQTEWYEEARSRFTDPAVRAQFDDGNGFTYRPEVLLGITTFTSP